MPRAPTILLMLALTLLCVASVDAAGVSFQRMGVLSHQTLTLAPGGSGGVQARCMDKNRDMPGTTDRFTQVLHGQPGAATVRKSNGETASLQQALDRGWLEIHGENSAARERHLEHELEKLHSGDMPVEELLQVFRDKQRELFDEVMLSNASGTELTILIDQSIVVGGAQHEPFPFDAADRVDPDQSKTWKRLATANMAAQPVVQQVQKDLHLLGGDPPQSGQWDQATRDVAQRIAGTDDMGSLRTAITSKVTELQTSLLLSGQRANPSGTYDASTQAAVRSFQKQHRLPTTGRLDAATHGLLAAQVELARNWVAAASVYVAGMEPTAQREQLLKAAKLSPKLPLNEKTKELVTASLQLPFDRLRPKLSRLGYDVPPGNDLLAWRALATQFQSEHRIPDAVAGAFDVRTIAIVDGVVTALNDIELRAELDPTLLGGTIIGGAKYSLLLRVPTIVATQIRATINRTLGREVLKIRESDRKHVDLLVVDSLDGTVDENVRGLLELEHVGSNLAEVNGVAISRMTIGNQDVVVTSSGGLNFRVPEQTAQQALRKTGELIGPTLVNPSTLRKYIRQEIGGASFVVALGPQLDGFNIEDMVNVPVVRAADLERPVADIVQRLQAAQNRPLDLDRAVILSGLAKNVAQLAQLSAEGYQREDDAIWLAEQKRVRQYAKALDLRMTDKLDQHVGAARDLIVIFAHADGQSFYLPGKKHPRRIGIEELNKYSKQFAENRPTILLLACNTGKLGGSAESLAAQLIAMGVGAVIAPRDPIDVTQAADFLQRLMEQPPGRSLVQRVVQAQISADAGGRIRFIVFRNVGAELRAEALTAALSR